ncbi:endo-beta-1,4-glucanase [Epithele typhae]|uniref:endo-beta-1,4-glucanase n=1 Tax=Epithele typhae TaxID=378194 RepID=UPI002007C404|nr:endo-beta-1,4-glucanase [Epithele typhae]KAH9912303.1 endo-beta-1,4-glucanase [Epithele typhae]
MLRPHWILPLALLLPPLLAFSLPSSHPDVSSVPQGPNLAARSNGKLYFGTATNNDELNDTAYFALLDSFANFGQLTSAKAMKWNSTEPERGVFTFEQGDQIVNLAKQSGKLMRGHNCVWYQRIPDWVTDTNWTAPELAEVVREHCFNIVHHWAGDIWDVINEPFNDDGTWRETQFYQVLNTSYIPIALHAARAADPHTKLYINEYNITGTGPKSTSMKSLVRALKKAGVPLDGVGVQAHEIVGRVPEDVQRNLEELTALGLDVRFLTLPPTQEGLEQQRRDFAAIVGACARVERCVGVTVWDFTDEYSWIPGTFPGEGDGCPWDDNLQPKPAYYGTLDGFRSH